MFNLFAVAQVEVSVEILDSLAQLQSIFFLNLDQTVSFDNLSSAKEK